MRVKVWVRQTKNEDWKEVEVEAIPLEGNAGYHLDFDELVEKGMAPVFWIDPDEPAPSVG